jgi:energy-coupling factor transporter ATP-binding protein EcfA2
MATPPSFSPLRLETLSLRAFGAFSAEQKIPIGGRNLIIYGENGAGKSSIYRALRDLFARTPSDKAIERHAHVYALGAAITPRVTVEFSSGSPIVWEAGKHPGRPRADPRLAMAALRSAFLDYQSLLQTNAIHGTKRPNLFDLTVEILLHDFATEAGGKTVAELWQEVQDRKPWRHFRDGSHLPPVESACAIFNSTLDAAVEALKPKINELLADFDQDGMMVSGFERKTVRYEDAFFKNNRVFKGKALYPEIDLRGHRPHAPQHFLNEARLSALALAFYLAARLTCVPRGPYPGLKLLVLDDVLVGLDYGNRRPLLQLLETHFSDWQIVLLTHDRGWFEIVRALIPNNKWSSHELYEMVAVSGEATPLLRPVDTDIVRATLAQARDFIVQKHMPAAANYARSACELLLRKQCEKRRVMFPYAPEPQKISFEKLKKELKDTLTAQPHLDALDAITSHQARVLNPLSHDPTTSLNQAEVVAAIDAVEALMIALRA